MQSEPRLKQSWRQPSSNPVVNVKIRNLSLNISEAHKLSQECEIQQTGPGTYIQPSSLQCLCSNSGGKLMASEFLPSKKSLANKQSRHLDITFHSVQNLKKNGLQLSSFLFFPDLFSFAKLFTINLSKALHWPQGPGSQGLWLFVRAFIGGGGGRGGRAGPGHGPNKKKQTNKPWNNWQK